MESHIGTNSLPEVGFLRLRSIIGDRKANPPIPALIPVSRSTWWAGVNSGRYPKPIKLGPRITAWSVEDIRELISESRRSRHIDVEQNLMAKGTDGSGVM